MRWRLPKTGRSHRLDPKNVLFMKVFAILLSLMILTSCSGSPVKASKELNCPIHFSEDDSPEIIDIKIEQIKAWMEEHGHHCIAVFVTDDKIVKTN